MTRAAGDGAADRSAITNRSSSKIRASFIQTAEPHLQVLSDADRLADEIRNIVIETVPPPSRIPRDGEHDEPEGPITKRHRKP
jgi:hypothetical protein